MNDLERKVEELSGELQRHTELVRAYKKCCDDMEGWVGQAFVSISELRDENAKLKEEVSRLRNIVAMTDLNARTHVSELRAEVSENQNLSTLASLQTTQFKQEVAKLEQRVAELKGEVHGWGGGGGWWKADDV